MQHFYILIANFFFYKVPVMLTCYCRYESGDHVAVCPINDTAIVNKIGDILGVDLDTVISLNNLDGMPLTLRV